MTSHSLTSGSMGEELAGGPCTSNMVEQSAEASCASLSSGQLEVLRLVDDHLNSKEIGARLGISPHTVDQRIRGAIRQLGVTRRQEAARIVAACVGCRSERAAAPAAPLPEYQRLISQPPYIDAKPDAAQTDGAIGIQIRHADRTGRAGAGRLETEQGTVAPRSFLLPLWSTPHRPRNGLGTGQRLATIAVLAIASSFSAGMFLAGLESLARLLHLGPVG